MSATRPLSAVGSTLIAATIATALAASAAFAQDPAAAPQTGGAAAGPITPSTPAVKGVQSLLGKSVTAVTTAGHARDLMELTTKADHDRLASAPVDWADVDAATDAFQAAWRTQYGTSFKLDDKISIAFTEPTMHVDGLTATTGPATMRAVDTGPSPVTITMTDPARRSGVLLHVARDGAGDDTWRLDLPDTVTAQTLHDSLLRHLRSVTDDRKSWPTDVDQAYVYAAQHLLSAVGESAAPR